ncbi:heme ABC exporter ATP-binding protein CcmA [Brevibacillus ginsengisoli]|uniref:heme ABC exporter ATP-binding protein CcmA n=1 Tax=Brevibacillus ginsengisoli TaxID=363854 RepID=UPI003CFA737D
MIQVHSITKTVGDKAILRGVTFKIERGESVAVLGSNGVGKSTLLRLLSLLTKPTSGEIELMGVNTKKSPDQLKAKIGFVSHNSMLYDHFSPMENLIFHGKLYGVSDCEAKAKRMLDEVGMRKFMHEPVRSFSRGMLQRTSIAKALLASPEILLLDEPHTGLDQQAVVTLNQVMARLKNEGTTCMMVTHDFVQAAAVCDRALIMSQGIISDDFYLEEKDQAALAQKYGKRVAINP